ncbi:unnamed protein product, partial [Prorocentrum cordatum]
MEVLYSAVWELLRGAGQAAGAGVIASSSSARVKCLPCACSCEPRITCPGGHSSDNTVSGLTLPGTLALAAVSAAAGACSVLLALRNSGAGAPPAAGPPATSGARDPHSPARLSAAMAANVADYLASLGISPGDFILERYDIAGPEEQLLAAGTLGADIAAWLPSVGGAMGAGNPATGAAHVHHFRAVPAPATCDALRTAAEGRLGLPPGPRAVPNLAGRAGVGAPGAGAGAAGAGAPAAGAAAVAPAAAPPAAAPGAALGAGLAAGAAAGVAPAAGGVLVVPPVVPAAAAAAPAPAAPIAAAAPAAPAAG